MSGANDRFERQERFAPLGSAGQRRLAEARVLIVGCGALGGVLAQTLVRSGVGQLVLVDRDLVEHSNLPRQVLFEDRHAEGATSKIAAALETLGKIGGPTRLEGHATHLDASNIEGLAQGATLILDGTDNLATRYLLNDYAIAHGVPWVYGGVVGAAGLVLAVQPDAGPCLRCVFRDPPPAGSLPTCDTAGVILPAVGAIASIQAGLALRLLANSDGPASSRLESQLVEVDVWNGEVRSVHAARDPGCPACAEREFEFLDAPVKRQAVALCGRDAVQVRGRPGQSAPPDLDALESTLRGVATDVRRAGALLRFEVEAHRVTVFPDGRALVEGTEDLERALSLYDRYVGS